MTTTTRSIRLEDETLQEIQEDAERLGRNPSALMQEEIEWLTGLSDRARLIVRNLSKGTGLRPAFLLNGIILDYAAQRAAYDEVFGKSTRVFLEFQTTPDGPPPANELFDSLKEFYMNEFEGDKKQQEEAEAAHTAKWSKSRK